MSDTVRVMTDKKNYENIAKAIRNKTGEDIFYYPEEMAGKMQGWSTIDTSRQYILYPKADVLSHGEITGLNPIYNNIANNGWIFYDTYIDRGQGGYNNCSACLKYPVDTTIWKKLYFDAEVYSTTSYYYKIMRVGLTRSSRSFDTGIATIDREVTLINYGNQTNYTHTDPWNRMPRTIVEVNLANFPERYGYIAWHSCDSQGKIYGIWLEE